MDHDNTPNFIPSESRRIAGWMGWVSGSHSFRGFLPSVPTGSLGLSLYHRSCGRWDFASIKPTGFPKLLSNRSKTRKRYGILCLDRYYVRCSLCKWRPSHLSTDMAKIWSPRCCHSKTNSIWNPVECGRQRTLLCQQYFWTGFVLKS